MNGKTGFLAQINNPKQIAEVIIKITSHPELLAKLGKAGFRRVKSDFSLEKMIESYTNTYLELSKKMGVKNTVQFRFNFNT